jgi:hypothetical protein
MGSLSRIPCNSSAENERTLQEKAVKDLADAKAFADSNQT